MNTNQPTNEINLKNLTNHMLEIEAKNLLAIISLLDHFILPVNVNSVSK